MCGQPGAGVSFPYATIFVQARILPIVFNPHDRSRQDEVIRGYVHSLNYIVHNKCRHYSAEQNVKKHVNIERYQQY